MEMCFLKNTLHFKVKISKLLQFHKYSLTGTIYETLSNRGLPAACSQATTLLTMDKYAPDDVPNINAPASKLDSLQLQALLQNYHCAPGRPSSLR